MRVKWRLIKRVKRGLSTTTGSVTERNCRDTTEEWLVERQHGTTNAEKFHTVTTAECEAPADRWLGDGEDDRGEANWKITTLEDHEDDKTKLVEAAKCETKNDHRRGKTGQARQLVVHSTWRWQSWWG